MTFSRSTFILFTLLVLVSHIKAETWTRIDTVSQNLYSISCINANTCWSVGNRGTILKTTNGGTSWTSQTSGTLQNLSSVTFLDANTGYAVGSIYQSGYHGTDTVYKTTNGGSTWTTSKTGSTSSSGLFSIYCANTNTCWTVGDNDTVFKTMNGGINWAPHYISGRGSPFFSIYFIGLDTGYAVGGADAVGGSGIVSKTVDGGNTWVSQNNGVMGYEYTFSSVYFINTNVGWAVGYGSSDSGVIVKTTNGGATWTTQIRGVHVSFKNVFFVDANNGWASASTSLTPYSYFYHTTNGGATWTEQDIGVIPFGWPSSVCFTDVNTGYVVGMSNNKGIILKYNPSGTSLFPLHPTSNNFSLWRDGTLHYSLTNSEHIQALLLDLDGREKLRLLDENQSAGSYIINLPDMKIPNEYLLDLKVDGVQQPIFTGH